MSLRDEIKLAYKVLLANVKGIHHFLGQVKAVITIAVVLVVSHQPSW